MIDNPQIKASSSWDLLGGPRGGSVYSLAVTSSAEYKAFAATGVGIFCSKGSLENIGKKWDRLVESPGRVMSVVVSPGFDRDRCVAAGSQTGVYISLDGGESWKQGALPRTSSAVQSIVFSPNFSRDGIILAGTAEDGVLVSENRGLKWSTRNFGFLDACVYTIAISPEFAIDEMAFAGTNTGLYYTYNAGRAWRELPFLEDTGPILSLAISPSFVDDGTIFAGTEEGGLLYSRSKGKSWSVLNSPGSMINAVQISPRYDQDHSLIISTEEGVFRSSDQGNHWQKLFEIEAVACLVGFDQVLLIGLIDEGILRSTDMKNLEQVGGLFAREITDFKLSPSFEKDGFAVACGFGEGIWCTTDKGHTWFSLNDDLPGPGIYQVVLSPTFNHNYTMYAASTEGVLISRDKGQHWDICYSEPVNSLAISPSGHTLMAGTDGQGVVTSRDSGGHWGSLPSPWEIEGDIKAVALGSDNQFFISSVDLTSHNLEIGYGKPGQWYRIYSQPSAKELVFFWIPSSFSVDNLWYASTGARIWRMGLRTDAKTEGMPIRGGSVDEDNPLILALSGIQALNKRLVLASTGKKIYQSEDGIDWQEMADFGDYRIIGLASSPNFKENRTIYAMSLGGLVWQSIMK